MSLTPQNLEEAIKVALCHGPLCEVIQNAAPQMQNFLAQKFMAAYQEAESDEELARLEKLWNTIIKGDHHE